MKDALPIEPRRLAENIEAGCFEAESIAKLPDPSRWRELLWWLAWTSHRPGSLKKLAEEILAGLTTAEQKAVEINNTYHWNEAWTPSTLSAELYNMCVGKDCGLKHHFKGPVELFSKLFAAMDRHAAGTASTIAHTEVSKRVFRELEFSASQNVPVPIVGESRIGKTSPAAVWCSMRPGRARLVTVPPSNRERDFVAAHADALDIAYTPRVSTWQLRNDVQYVLQHSGLFIAYDESQFLVPANYNKSTPPHRLNWVRCQVIDRNIGCSFLATPQSYRQTLDQYVKTTGYRIEQWLGRLAPAVVLQPDLGKDDLLAVAKIHFPDMPEPFLKLICARAMTSEGYLKNMEMTAKRARFLASENGRARPTLQDVKDAIAAMMPETVANHVGNAALTPSMRRKPLADPPALIPASRAITPGPTDFVPSKDAASRLPKGVVKGALVTA